MKIKNKYIQRLRSVLFIIAVIACLGISFLGYAVLSKKLTVEGRPVGADKSSKNPIVHTERIS